MPCGFRQFNYTPFFLTCFLSLVKKGHVRIQEFSSGGSRSVRQKKALTTFFLCFFVLFFFVFCFSPQLILQKSYGQFSKKSIIFQGSRGGPTFSRGGPTFSRGGGGSNCLFTIETHITCDFPGGSGPPVPPPPPSGSALEGDINFVPKSVRCQSVHLYIFTGE